MHLASAVALKLESREVSHLLTSEIPPLRQRSLAISITLRTTLSGYETFVYNPPFMDTARISDLLAPFLRAPLSEIQLRQLSVYLGLLLRWNQRTNLTALRDAESIVTRHFGESLFAAAQLFPDPASPLPGAENAALPHVVDVGSGAGFPGIPVHIWSSPIKSTLVESNNKKVAFLREVCRALTLINIDVFAGRAENLPTRADVVTLRAVDRFDTILPVAAVRVAPAGRGL
jgi:16S rRNA (guanine527-N7)-methyltransferase